MKEYKIKGIDKQELRTHNKTWGWEEWETWAIKHHLGLVIEDGEVKGWITEPELWHV